MNQISSRYFRCCCLYRPIFRRNKFECRCAGKWESQRMHNCTLMNECVDRTKWFKCQQCNPSWHGVKATSLDIRTSARDLDTSMRLAVGQFTAIWRWYSVITSHRCTTKLMKIYSYLELMTRALARRPNTRTHGERTKFFQMDEWQSKIDIVDVVCKNASCYESCTRFNDISGRFSILATAVSCLFWAQIIDAIAFKTISKLHSLKCEINGEREKCEQSPHGQI